jgi:hypothetical protein
MSRVWTLDADDDSTITTAGLYTASTDVGDHTITATDGSVPATATVDIVDSAPTVATPAAGTVSNDGTSVALSVLGSDLLGESGLTYTWSTTEDSPAPVTFITNGSNAAKSTTAELTSAGNYTFVVTITNAASLSVTSDASVPVGQITSALTISPSDPTVAQGAAQQFTVSGVDQFNNAVTISGATWSVLGDDAGTIDSDGNYTAPSDNSGTFTIEASLGTQFAVTAATVPTPPPTITQPGSYTQTSNTTFILTMAATSQDPIDYTWQLGTSPQGAQAPELGNDDQQTADVTFLAAGSYTFEGTATDEVTGQSVSTSVPVTVSQVATSLDVTATPQFMQPVDYTATSESGQEFVGTELDQFGNAMLVQPNESWSTADPSIGAIDPLFTHGNQAIVDTDDWNVGATTVTATAGSLSGTAPFFVDPDNYTGAGSGVAPGNSVPGGQLAEGTVMTNQNPQVTFVPPEGGSIIGGPFDGFHINPANPSATSVTFGLNFTNPVTDLYFSAQDVQISVYSNGSLLGTTTDPYDALGQYQNVTSVQVTEQISNNDGSMNGLSFKPAILGVALGDGTPNQILQASDDGTQNLVPLHLMVDSDFPTGTQVTLTTTEPDEVDVWSNSNPSSGDTPLLGGETETDTTTWTVGSDTIPTTLYVGATQASQDVGDIQFTLAADISGAPATSPQDTSTTQPASAIAIRLETQNAPNGGAAGDDWSGQTEQWMVGQMVDLVADVEGPAALIGNPTYQWTVPGNVDHYWSESGTNGDGAAQVIPLTSDDAEDAGDSVQHTGTSDDEVQFFWTWAASPGFTPMAVSVQIGNIGGRNFGAKTTFDLQTPSVTANAAQGVAGVGTRISTGLTAIGLVPPAGLTAGMTIPATVYVPTGFSGSWNFLQLVDSERSGVAGGSAFHFANYGDWALDTASPYPARSTDPYTAAGAWNADGTAHDLFDSPNWVLSPNTTIQSIVDSFLSNVMFLPSGTNSQWVPVADEQWSFSITASRPNIFAAWTFSNQQQKAGQPDIGALPEPTWNLVDSKPFVRLPGPG